MALNTFVKISHVNNLSDARYCAGMGVDLMGFNTDRDTPDFIRPEKFTEIAEWISGVEFVAEFETDNFQKINDIISRYPVQYVQYTHPELANAILSLGYEAIFKTKLPAYQDLPEMMETLHYLKDKANYIILDEIADFSDPETKKIIHHISKEIPVMLGGNITKANIDAIQKEFDIQGISLPGGDEIKPGFKNFDELADVLEKIEVDD